MFSSPQQRTRVPAVAGQFYPANESDLFDMVQTMLEQAKSVSCQHIKAVIVPHAGLIYSGPVAASAYLCIKPQADVIRRVILLGPSHRVGFQGMALSSAAMYKMPFGDIELDQDAMDMIRHLPQVIEMDQAHEHEHSLEVQLPFLQNLLNDFTLVPIVVGDCPTDQVSQVLDLLWGGEETLIVISSDLSHFHAYDEARKLDSATSDAILEFKPESIGYEDACGRNPVNGFLVSARQHALSASLLDLRNSGDTAGSRDRVVGYGAFIFND